MPKPTNPACRGSCPDPPPEISATLPGVSDRRRTNLRSSPSTTMLAWAAAKPSRLSASTVSTALMSFFMPSSCSPPLERPVAVDVGELREPARDLGEHLVGGAIAGRIAEVRQLDHHVTHRPFLVDDLEPSGMGTSIGQQECITLSRREMTDRENRLEMLGRYWRRIDGVGDLGDEAAVLADRRGKALARAGRPIVDHRLQHALVGGDRLDAELGIGLDAHGSRPPGRARSGGRAQP